MGAIIDEPSGFRYGTLVFDSWGPHLQHQSALMLDRQVVTLARLHLGIDGLAEHRSDMLGFGIGRILDEVPQMTPYALLGRAAEILPDISWGNAVSSPLVTVQWETQLRGHLLGKESSEQVKTLGLPPF